jgi:hypothetical protein
MNKFNNLPLELQNYIYKFVGCHKLAELIKEENILCNYLTCSHCHHMETGCGYNKLKRFNDDGIDEFLKPHGPNRKYEYFSLRYGEALCSRCYMIITAHRVISNHTWSKEFTDANKEYLDKL